MRIHHIRLLEKEDGEHMAVSLECTSCEKRFTGHGFNNADFIYREVFELRCQECGHQDQPASPCPHCDDVKPALRVVE